MSDPKPNEAATPAPPGEMEFIMKMLRGQIDPIYPPTPAELEALGLGLAEAAEMDAHDLIESICGAADNSQEVEQYDGTLGVTQVFVAQHQGEVGQLQWNNNLGAIYNNPGNVSGVRWCSGTLITNDLFLTAGHCFDQLNQPTGWQVPKINGTQNLISPQEIATRMHVNFNYQYDPAGNLRTEQSYAVTQLVEYRLGNKDFAIVRLAGNPGAAWGVTPVAQNDAAVGDMLCIIQHPAGKPKRVEAGPLSQFVGDSIRYNDIDTLGGTSGSGILGPNGTIVGVHTNGGCNAQMTGHNFGLRLSVLRANSPTIQSLPPQIGTTFKKFVDDGPTTVNLKKQLDDPQPIKKMFDEPPPNFKKLRDDVTPKRKIVDDPGGIKKIADDGPKLKAADDQPAPPAEYAEQPEKPKLWSTEGIRPKLKWVDDHSLAHIKNVIDNFVVVRPPIPIPGPLMSFTQTVNDDPVLAKMWEDNPKLAQKWVDDLKHFDDRWNQQPTFKGPEDTIPPNKVVGPDRQQPASDPDPFGWYDPWKPWTDHLKKLEDEKQKWLDMLKNLRDKQLNDEKAFIDNKNALDPNVDPKAGGFAAPIPGMGEATPFILSTPHHAALGGTVESQIAASSRAAQLAQLEAAIAQAAQQYQELFALYQALAGGQ